MGAEASIILDETEAARAQCWLLLAHLLAGPPDAGLLRRVAGLAGDETPLGAALGGLADAARDADPERVAAEHFDLFIGVGRGEILPYASYYLTGFLHERPLARLRGDLDALGIGRREGVAEPEDHAATLCEAMGGLISGQLGGPPSLARQQAFFEAHVLPWAERLFADLEAAQAARFYRPVGRLGRILVAVEAQGFALAPAA